MALTRLEMSYQKNHQDSSHKMDERAERVNTAMQASKGYIGRALTGWAIRHICREEKERQSPYCNYSFMFIENFQVLSTVLSTYNICMGSNIIIPIL